MRPVVFSHNKATCVEIEGPCLLRVVQQMKQEEASVGS